MRNPLCHSAASYKAASAAPVQCPPVQHSSPDGVHASASQQGYLRVRSNGPHRCVCCGTCIISSAQPHRIATQVLTTDSSRGISIASRLARSELSPAGRIAYTYPRRQTARSSRRSRLAYAGTRRRRCARAELQEAVPIGGLRQAGSRVAPSCSSPWKPRWAPRCATSFS
jgi:hypothetical protein